MQQNTLQTCALLSDRTNSVVTDVPLQAEITAQHEARWLAQGRHAPCVTMLKASLASSACSPSLNSPHREPT